LETGFKETIDSSKIIYFRVGADGNDKDWSPIFSLAVTACGDETLDVSDVPRALNFIFKEGDSPSGQTSTVKPDVYMSYFTSSEALCAPAPEKYEIVHKTG